MRYNPTNVTLDKNIAELQKVIPRDLLVPNEIKSSLYFMMDLLIYLILFTLLWQSQNLYLLVLLWLFAGINILGLYQFGHDASHGSLFKNKNISRIVAQIAFLPCLHPVGQWKFGHNIIHHGKTVMLKGDLAWHPRSLERYNKMNMIEKLSHRFFWSMYGVGFYYMIKMWLQGLILHPVKEYNAKRDIILVSLYFVLIYASVFLISGNVDNTFDFERAGWFVAKVLLLPFIVANYFIGMTVYIQHINPDIQWQPEQKWDNYYGQVIGTTNYKLPWWINIFIHNLFIHVPHHVQPALPFYNLPKAMNILMQKSGKDIFYRKSIIADYIASVKNCKLYDRESQKWQRYDSSFF